jgi:hypothetical protein
LGSQKSEPKIGIPNLAFWQRHGIGLDVGHVVTLPELLISLQKELNSLQKGVGGSDASKWGLADMVLGLVRGRSRFSGFFCCLIL